MISIRWCRIVKFWIWINFMGSSGVIMMCERNSYIMRSNLIKCISMLLIHFLVFSTCGTHMDWHSAFINENFARISITKFLMLILLMKAKHIQTSYDKASLKLNFWCIHNYRLVNTDSIRFQAEEKKKLFETMHSYSVEDLFDLPHLELCVSRIGRIIAVRIFEHSSLPHLFWMHVC